MNVGAVEAKNAVSDAMTVEMPTQEMSLRHSRSKEPEGMAASQEQIKHRVEEMQHKIDQMDVSLEYSTYGERGDKIAIKIVNKQTGEVIREFPAKEIQNLYDKMSELAGMIFNKQI